ncbi:MAG: hypothetical protein LBB06_02215 [Endomicrobium sp.]|jgi:ABC-type oligopeptide transport system substrate-binding subunit|nr:hypothetical protein [Endomicrobium sp.]
MKKFVLFAAMFAVFTFALAACCCSKKAEEAPVTVEECENAPPADPSASQESK